MLEFFEELSRDKSPERRRELMFKITDQFMVGADRYENRQQALFLDIANKVLGDMTDEDQGEFGLHAATKTDMPHAVVKGIAEGDSNAALPILEHSEVLTDEDLISVAASKGQSRLQAIAKRRHLNTEVTDVLVERGNDTVLTTVSGNQGARFSDEGFNKLAAKSDGNADLLQNLADRKDLPDNVAEELLPKLDEKAAKRLRALMESNEFAAIDVLSQVQAKANNHERVTRSNRLAAKVIARDIATGAITPAQGLAKTKSFGRIDDIAHVAASAFDIEEKVVANALRAKDGSPGAMLFRSADMTREAFLDFEETRCVALRRPYNVENANSLYERVTPEDATKALRFLKLRQAG